MALKAGKISQTDPNDSDYAGSMAQAMEEAFLKAWPEAMDGAPLPDTDNAYARLLFVAVAQGVLKHLSQHAGDAFEVHSVMVTQSNSLVESSGQLRIGNRDYDINVTQNANTSGGTTPQQPVESQGEGSLRILVSDLL